MAVIVWGIVRIIPRWLRTQEGITQRRMQALEQRIRHSERELSVALWRTTAHPRAVHLFSSSTDLRMMSLTCSRYGPANVQRRQFAAAARRSLRRNPIFIERAREISTL